MKTRALLKLVLLGVWAVSCGAPMTRGDQVATLTGVAGTGKGVYTANCASCHGVDGKGTASAPGVDLTDHVKDHTEAVFLGFIIDGVKGTAMASYASLSDQQLADLYVYIKSL
jgi:mono/diheme cytochrome c family protein